MVSRIKLNKRKAWQLAICCLGYWVLASLSSCAGQHQPIILTSTGHLEYPSQAKRQAIEGWVQVAYDVSSNGLTSNLEILDSEPKQIFDRAALDFIRTWRFQPFTIKMDVQRVSSVIRFQIDANEAEYVPPPL